MVALSILLFIIGMWLIDYNQNTEYPKNWIGLVGYLICLFGMACGASQIGG